MQKRLIVIATFILFGVCVFVPGLLPMSDLIWKRTVKPSINSIEFLIDRVNAPVSGVVIHPETTAELKKWFQGSDENHVPRVFVDQMPRDFNTQGDSELFAQVISALILRENEKIMKERAVLTLLVAKSPDGKKWTSQEANFFNHLVKRYDSQAKRTVSAQIADLAAKIYPIPPLVGVLQAAEATNWGKEQWSSPFAQTGWLDKETYDRIPFKSLIQATESYAVEMNGLPPLEVWRFSRSEAIKEGETNIGYRVLRWLGDYDQDDLKYVEKLERRSEELDLEVPDSLSFIKPVKMESREIKIGNHSLQAEFARTKEERQQGLMFRPNIPQGTGMIFINEEVRPMGVWMKNTFVPLDVLFFDEGQRVTEILEHLNPVDETPHRAAKPALGMVELPAGTVQQYNIKVGDKVAF